MDINEYELESLKSEIDSLEKNIEYKYNKKGELIHKKTNKKCQKLNNIEYDLIAYYTTKYIEYHMRKVLKLKIMYVPQIENCSLFDYYNPLQIIPQCEIYTSNDFLYNPKCLLIIQGNGKVRPGLWARQVCINDNLNKGSMIPYIELAIKNNLSVIILNPNERNDIYDKNLFIEQFLTNEMHCLNVYNNVIKMNKVIKELFIVAHSRGGTCTMEILKENEGDLIKGKIKKIAFIDSSIKDCYKNLSEKGIFQLRKICKNFVSSLKPLGHLVSKFNDKFNNTGIDKFSAGHNVHEYTCGYAINEVFKWLLNKKF